MIADAEGSEVRNIFLCEGRRCVQTEEAIIREIPLEILLDGRKVAAIACSGMHVGELGIGFLLSEGLLRGQDDFAGLEVSDDGRQVLIRTAKAKSHSEREVPSCLRVASSGARSTGRPPLDFPLEGPAPDGLRISSEEVGTLMERFLEQAGLHDKTGGTHAAALVLEGRRLVVREDIGRHNTIDMLGGYAFLNRVDCRGTMILRTGRVSAEIVQKIGRIGVPVVASLSVPTTLAIELAREAGMTLIGSVRGGRMKIYSHEGRVRM